MPNIEQFARVPLIVLDDPCVDALDIAIYAAVASYASADIAFPGIEKIMKRAHTGRMRTISGLRKLEERGHLRIERGRRERNRRCSNIYHLRAFESFDSMPDVRTQDVCTNGVCTQDEGFHSTPGGLYLDNSINKTSILPKAEKKPYGEGGAVLLTEKEYSVFEDKYGATQTARLIAALADYKLAHGKKYKSDAAAIRSWVIDRVKPRPLSAPSGSDTLPRASEDMPCSKCGATIPTGEIACPSCDYLVADILKGASH